MAKTDSIEHTHSRYERKFFVSGLTRDDIESAVLSNPAGFSEIYYERSVNNIYFDSFDMANYFDNVSGKPERRKIRVRWYGDLFGRVDSPVLEVKERLGGLCRKFSFPVKGFVVDEGLSKESFRNAFDDCGIPEVLKLELLCLNFTMLNSYRRRYYLSKDGKYRVTLDFCLEFYEMSPFANTFLNKSIDHASSIVEIKYLVSDTEGVDRITNRFPFRMTKSSKYIMGLERLNLTKTYSHV